MLLFSVLRLFCFFEMFVLEIQAVPESRTTKSSQVAECPCISNFGNARHGSLNHSCLIEKSRESSLRQECTDFIKNNFAPYPISKMLNTDPHSICARNGTTWFNIGDGILKTKIRRGTKYFYVQQQEISEESCLVLFEQPILIDLSIPNPAYFEFMYLNNQNEHSTRLVIDVLIKRHKTQQSSHSAAVSDCALYSLAFRMQPEGSLRFLSDKLKLINDGYTCLGNFSLDNARNIWNSRLAFDFQDSDSLPTKQHEDTIRIGSIIMEKNFSSTVALAFFNKILWPGQSGRAGGPTNYMDMHSVVYMEQLPQKLSVIYQKPYHQSSFEMHLLWQATDTSTYFYDQEKVGYQVKCKFFDPFIMETSDCLSCLTTSSNETCEECWSHETLFKVSDTHTTSVFEQRSMNELSVHIVLSQNEVGFVKLKIQTNFDDQKFQNGTIWLIKNAKDEYWFNLIKLNYFDSLNHEYRMANSVGLPDRRNGPLGLSEEEINRSFAICRVRATTFGQTLSEGSWSKPQIVKMNQSSTSTRFFATTYALQRSSAQDYVTSRQNLYFASMPSFDSTTFFSWSIGKSSQNIWEPVSNQRDSQVEQRPLIDISQSGIVRILENPVTAWATEAPNVETVSSRDRVGCYHFMLNRWYAFKQEKNKDAFALVTFEGSTGSLVWEEIPWTELFTVKNIPVSIKCPPITNYIVWTEMEKVKGSSETSESAGLGLRLRNQKFHVHRLFLDRNLGYIAGDPEELDITPLCHCSNSTKLSTGSIDISYLNNDPYSLALVVACHQHICLSNISSLTKTTKPSQLLRGYKTILESSEIIQFLQLDPPYLYYMKSSSTSIWGYEYQSGHSIAISPQTVNRYVSTALNSSLEQSYYYNWMYVFKDSGKFPTPPHHCTFHRMVVDSVDIKMTGRRAINISINRLRNQPADCKMFSQQKKIITVQFGVIPSYYIVENSSAVEANNFTCKGAGMNPQKPFETTVNCMSQRSLASDASQYAMLVQNLLAHRWYYFEVSVSPSVTQDHLRKWYSGNLKPNSLKKVVFTHYSPPESNARLVIGGLVGALILSCIVASAIGLIAWRQRRIWQLPQQLNRLNATQIQLEQKLGEGHFGEVRMASLKSGKTEEVKIVVKTLKENATERDQRHFREEAMIVSKLDCPQIVKCFGICLQSRPIMLAFEFANGGSLDSYLKKHENQALLSGKDTWMMSRDVLEACIYLEAEGYIHRDIAARNCLLQIQNDKPVQVKLADFGLAKDIGHLEGAEYGVDDDEIPIQWTPPEALRDGGKSNKKSDIWSFGVLIWEIFTWCSTPFDSCVIPDQWHDTPCHRKSSGIHGTALVRKISGWERFNLLLIPDPCICNLTDRMKDEVLAKCFIFVPEKRPSFSELKTILLPLREEICQLDLKRVTPAEPQRRKKSSVVSATPCYGDLSLQQANVLPYCSQNVEKVSTETTTVVPAYADNIPGKKGSQLDETERQTSISATPEAFTLIGSSCNWEDHTAFRRKGKISWN